ncbi:PREDICTED: CD151 antigen-like [Thamnophis sirtalis]|uniref:CD151 antigen-like n=1 Tax=Thamnophis sirtalis TaxID=35019 RepID=A0A6I9XHT2_9SAUR|nr:PREDICTED: CD151 antigen-like [Thamnophis sirtalis]
MREYSESKETCMTICLKYLLFIFNFFFWLAGGAVMAVGIWTLAEKSDYISLLQSNIYLATAYILVVAGAVVMITGILGCCATFREQRSLLKVVSFSSLNGLQLEPRMRRGTCQKLQIKSWCSPLDSFAIEN